MVAAYRRPALESVEFRDALGEPIPYGRRWGADGPPGDSYSVVTHPERFRPLHAVAGALIEYVADRFDVTVEEGSELASDTLHARVDVVRAVRVTPAGSSAAPVTIVFTGFPGIVVHVDEEDSPFPACGCDACDDSWEDVADALERKLLATTATWG